MGAGDAPAAGRCEDSQKHAGGARAVHDKRELNTVVNGGNELGTNKKLNGKRAVK